MKIAMFTNTYLPHVGGVARSIETFASDLRQQGHRVMIIAPEFPDCESHDRTEPDIIRVPAVKEVSGSDFSMRIPVPFMLDETIDAFVPDIIHSHHPYLLGDSAFRAARRRNLPLFFTHHTLYEQYTHHLNIDIQAVQQFAASLSTQFANLCDVVIAPSWSIAKMMEDRGVTQEITVIPTGVDIGRFSSGSGSDFRTRNDIPRKGTVIGHVGRLAPEKNLEFLAQAAARAVRKKKDAVFLVVGEGPSRKDIRKIFEQQQVPQQLRMTGSLSGQDLVDAYHAMDLFAFASHSETQGMVLTEAMAAGTPVIALEASGVREVLRDGENGRMLETSASVEAFGDTLAAALAQENSLQRWQQGARRTAADFGRESCARKLDELYQKTLELAALKNGDQAQDPGRWESVMRGLQAEWDLLMEKTKSLIDTVQIDENTTESDR